MAIQVGRKKAVKKIGQKARYRAVKLAQIVGIEASAEEYNVHPSTIYKWIEKYRSHGKKGLETKSSRPNSHPNTLPENQKKRIRQLALSHPGESRIDMAKILTKEGLTASHTLIGKVLKAEGLATGIEREKHLRPATIPWKVTVRQHVFLTHNEARRRRWRCHGKKIADTLVATYFELEKPAGPMDRIYLFLDPATLWASAYFASDARMDPAMYAFRLATTELERGYGLDTGRLWIDSANYPNTQRRRLGEHLRQRRCTCRAGSIDRYLSQARILFKSRLELALDGLEQKRAPSVLKVCVENWNRDARKRFPNYGVCAKKLLERASQEYGLRPKMRRAGLKTRAKASG